MVAGSQGRLPTGHCTDGTEGLGIWCQHTAHPWASRAPAAESPAHVPCCQAAVQTQGPICWVLLEFLLQPKHHQTTSLCWVQAS